MCDSAATHFPVLFLCYLRKKKKRIKKANELPSRLQLLPELHPPFYPWILAEITCHRLNPSTFHLLLALLPSVAPGCAGTPLTQFSELISLPGAAAPPCSPAPRLCWALLTAAGHSPASLTRRSDHCSISLPPLQAHGHLANSVPSLTRAALTWAWKWERVPAVRLWFLVAGIDTRIITDCLVSKYVFLRCESGT